MAQFIYDSGEFPVVSSSTTNPITDGTLPIFHRNMTIEEIRYSGPSRLIFGLDEHTGEQLVLKGLGEETDRRYNLSTIERRQQVQSYAFYRNVQLTPDVYLGVVSYDPVLNLTCGSTIELGSVNGKPDLENLNRGREYGVLMKRLPDGTQLNELLMQVPQFFKSYYLKLVATRIAHMHLENGST